MIMMKKILTALAAVFFGGALAYAATNVSVDGNIVVGGQITNSNTAVNNLNVGGAATGSPVTLTPGGTGSDTNIDIVAAGKGTGKACLGGTTASNASVCAAKTASAVNEVVVTGAACRR
jgi:hypothetical protein